MARPSLLHLAAAIWKGTNCNIQRRACGWICSSPCAILKYQASFVVAVENKLVIIRTMAHFDLSFQLIARITKGHGQVENKRCTLLQT